MHPIDFQQRLQDNSVEETKVYLSRSVWTNKEAIMWNINLSSTSHHQVIVSQCKT